MSDMISDVSGIRIDQYLTSKLNITRSKIEKMIKEKGYLQVKIK